MATIKKTAKQPPAALVTIARFFDSYSLHSALKQLVQAMEAAASTSPYKKGPPHDMVFLMEGVAELLQAANTAIDGPHRAAALLINQPASAVADMLQWTQYVRIGPTESPWNCFPRHLNMAQYQNPYLALAQTLDMATQKQWLQTCKNISKYALSRESMVEEYTAHTILLVQRKLLRLVEACHLLYVRLE